MKRAKIICQDRKAEVHLYDVIGQFWGEGISADGFRQDIEALGDIDSLTIRINSPGGNVFDGLTMYNALRRLEIPVTAAGDGGAASAAAIVAMGADTVTMAETARLMIHEAEGGTMGRAEDHRAMAARLDSINATQADILAATSGIDVEEVKAMLTAETWFTGPEAVEAGFVSEVTEPLQIAACIPKGRYKHTPSDLVWAVTKRIKQQWPGFQPASKAAPIRGVLEKELDRSRPVR